MRNTETVETPQQRPTMTAKEVAEFFGVSRRHVYSMIKVPLEKGGLPVVYVGTVPRFHRKDIENLRSKQ